MKRLGVHIPEELLKELNKVAQERGITTTYLVRQFFKLGLVVVKSPQAELIIRENGTDIYINLLL